MQFSLQNPFQMMAIALLGIVVGLAGWFIEADAPQPIVKESSVSASAGG